jgi:hypothetical protein
MRLVLLCLLSLAALPAWAGAPAPPPPHSAANLLRLHPAAWQLPASAARAGMRFEPETGAAADDPAAVGSLRAGDRTLRPLAVENVRTLADGSRHLAVNGALRQWTVASIDAQGRLVQDCVHGEAEARRRVEAANAAAKQVRK